MCLREITIVQAVEVAGHRILETYQTGAALQQTRAMGIGGSSSVRKLDDSSHSVPIVVAQMT